MAFQTILLVIATPLVLLLSAAAVLWQRRLRTEVPGPQPLPLIGNSLLVRNAVENMGTVKRLYSTYGSTFRLYVGTKLFVIITRPEDIKRVLGDPRIGERDRYLVKIGQKFLGDGLVCSFGTKWEVHRKIVIPTFSNKVLETFMPVFNDTASSLADSLDQTVGRELPVTHLVAAASLKMVSETVLGGSPTSAEISLHDVTSAVRRFISLSVKRLTRPWLVVLDQLFWWTQDLRQFRKDLALFNTYVNSLIAQKRAQVENEMKHSNGGTSSPNGVCAGANVPDRVVTRRQPFLELLVRSEDGYKLTSEDIRDEVSTLLSAGFETIATSLCFTLALLGLHPEWQQAVHQELDEVFGTGEDDLRRPVTTADLLELKLLERVIKESLRLFPVATMLPRYIPMDMCLGAASYKVPAGSCAVSFPYFTHRQTEFFPEPEKFDPDRFLPENLDRILPFSYIPFGAGARNCVGGRYAMMEMKTLLATVLRRFTVLPGSTMEELEDLHLSITISPANDVRVTFQHRIRT